MSGDFTVYVEDEFTFDTRAEAEAFAQSLYHHSPRTVDALLQYEITDHRPVYGCTNELAPRPKGIGLADFDRALRESYVAPLRDALS